MVCFTVRCDPLPDREEAFDRFITEKAKDFWLCQPGVKSFRVYGDKLVGWPERTIMIEMEDLASLQDILESDGRKRIRSEFMSHVSRVESQILDIIV